MGSTEVSSFNVFDLLSWQADEVPGVGPKVTQSVITAAFLFAFKDVLYEMTVKARKRVVNKA